MSKPLTIKQEKFCQEYVLTGDKSASYRAAYSCGNMKPETVNNNAYMLFVNSDITARINEIYSETRVRNKITIDEIVDMLAGMARFDISDIYDNDGNVKKISDMSPSTRKMITKIKSFEEFTGRGDSKEFIGYTKEVEITDKLGAIEKLMKHFGGYAKDNEQSKPEVNVNTSAIDITKLSPEALRELRDASKPSQ